MHFPNQFKLGILIVPGEAVKMVLGFITSRIKDAAHALSFLLKKDNRLQFSQRLSLVKQLYAISLALPCPHRQQEMLSFIETVLSLPDSVKGHIVEAGSFKGGSTAKLSLVAELTGRELIVFDSFVGLPENKEWDEFTRGMVKYKVDFQKGEYSGTLKVVRRNVATHGRIKRCRFVKGWFKDTMPKFKEPIAAIFLDVDLASSTQTCLKHLYPLLSRGGVLYSHDGHIPQVRRVFEDSYFWKLDVGCPRPTIEYLCKGKVLRITKS